MIEMCIRDSDKTAELNDRGVNVREPVSKGGGIHMTGVDQDGNNAVSYTHLDVYKRQYLY